MENLTTYKENIYSSHIIENLDDDIIEKMNLDEIILDQWNKSKIMDELENSSGMMEVSELELIQYYLGQVNGYWIAIKELLEEFEKIAKNSKGENTQYTQNDIVNILKNLLK